MVPQGSSVPWSLERKSVWKMNKTSLMQKTLDNPAVKTVSEAFTHSHQLKCVGEVKFVSPHCQPQRACRWFWLRPSPLQVFRGRAFQNSVLHEISQVRAAMKSYIDSWMWVCDGADWWLCSTLSLVKLWYSLHCTLMKESSSGWEKYLGLSESAHGSWFFSKAVVLNALSKYHGSLAVFSESALSLVTMVAGGW